MLEPLKRQPFLWSTGGVATHALTLYLWPPKPRKEISNVSLPLDAVGVDRVGSSVHMPSAVQAIRVPSGAAGKDHRIT